MANSFYRTSKLFVEASVKNGKTIMSDVFFTAPYKIMNPFYMNQDYMTVMCMSASSGILSGDTQEFDFLIKEGAKMEFTSQEYEKIHKMDSGEATRTTTVKIGKNACFYYNPLPTISFAQSAYQCKVNVELCDESSRFIMKEVLSSGRTSRGESFLYRYYHNLIQIKQGNVHLYRDNTLYDPDRMDLSSLGLYEGYTHLGNLLLFNTPVNSEWFHQVRELLEQADQIEGGVTTIGNQSYLVRVLGFQSEKISNILEKVLSLL